MRLLRKIALFTFVVVASAKNISSYRPLYQKHSDLTPVFFNVAGKTSNSQLRQGTDLPVGTWCVFKQLNSLHFEHG